MRTHHPVPTSFALDPFPATQAAAAAGGSVVGGVARPLRALTARGVTSVAAGARHAAAVGQHGKSGRLVASQLATTG